MNWKPELDELTRREAFAREMGGADKIKRQHDSGRLTVRERIDRIADNEEESLALLDRQDRRQGQLPRDRHDLGRWRV